jgi:ubiquinone/menaquinone biosynthesis C-methylase UbiE
LTNGAGTPSREEHRAYFEGQLASNREFWRRFGRMPAVAGRRVFDFGCGHGALSVELARAGADVYGVDIDTERIVFARDNLRERYPDVADRVRFDAAPIAHVQPDQSFDLAVSKDTFEHVSEIGAVARDLYRLLKPGGELWAGFSPLYWSPTGDHRRTGLPPILHAVLPRAVVLSAAGRCHGHPVRSLDDIGLNGMTPSEFRAQMRAAGFRFVSVAYNQGDKRLLRLMDRLRRIPRLERFATVSVYAILARPTPTGAHHGLRDSRTGEA